VNVTVPVIDEAAPTTSDETVTATRTAASRNPFALPCMLGSLMDLSSMARMISAAAAPNLRYAARRE
jgi:hypothetical protein